MGLFTRLHTVAIGDEDFTTESLAAVLEHLLTACPAAGLRLSDLLSAGIISPTIPNPASVSVSTRPRIGPDIPDLQIATDDALALVEAKVGAQLEATQLARYRAILARSGKPRTSLLTLSKFPLSPEDEKPDHELYWHQVAHLLRDTLQSEPLPDVSRFLVGEYLEFLRSQGLALDPPRSAMSRSVIAYLSSAGERSVFLGSSVRSLSILDAITELRPLADLLRLLDQALRAAIPTASLRLWSGTSSWRGAPWIGYNLDSMAYYACFYLDRPDDLVFETYLAAIDPTKAGSAPGQVFIDDKTTRWMNTLDLADVSLNFYGLPVGEQLEHLRSFLRHSWEVARTLAV